MEHLLILGIYVTWIIMQLLTQTRSTYILPWKDSNSILLDPKASYGMNVCCVCLCVHSDLTFKTCGHNV